MPERLTEKREDYIRKVVSFGSNLTNGEGEALLNEITRLRTQFDYYKTKKEA